MRSSSTLTNTDLESNPSKTSSNTVLQNHIHRHRGRV